MAKSNNGGPDYHLTAKCNKCGADYSVWDAYCGHCGALVSSAKREVVPKGTSAAWSELENKYVKNPTLATGFTVLWRAIKRWRKSEQVDKVITIAEIGIVCALSVLSLWFLFYSENHNYIRKYSVLSNNGYYALFKKGKQLTPYQYDTLILCSNGTEQLRYVIAKSSGKYGRLGEDGHIIDSCKFDYIDYRRYLHDGQYHYFYDFNNGWAITKNNGLYGYIKEKRKKGIPEIPPQFLDAGRFKDGFARVQYADKTYGWIDLNGDDVPWGKVYNCGEYSNGFAWISVDSEGKEYGYVDKKGNVTNLHATGIWKFDNGCAFFSKGNGWAMIDRNLKQITDFILYPRIDPSTKRTYFRYDAENKLWSCVYNGQECFINKRGEVFNNSLDTQLITPAFK